MAGHHPYRHQPTPVPTPAAARSAGLPRGAAFGLAVLSGLLVSLSLPPFGWWPLGVVGLAGFSGLLAGGHGRQARRPVGPAGRRGPSGHRRRCRHRAVRLEPVVGDGLQRRRVRRPRRPRGPVMAAAAALVPVRRRWGLVAGLPAALVVADWARARFPAGGLPIGGLALGQAGGPLAAVARLGGTLLVTGHGGPRRRRTGGAGGRLARPVERRRAARGPADRAWVSGVVALGLALALVVPAGRLGPDGAGSGPASRRCAWRWSRAAASGA